MLQCKSYTNFFFFFSVHSHFFRKCKNQVTTHITSMDIVSERLPACCSLQLLPEAECFLLIVQQCLVCPVWRLLQPWLRVTGRRVCSAAEYSSCGTASQSAHSGRATPYRTSPLMTSKAASGAMPSSSSQSLPSSLVRWLCVPTTLNRKNTHKCRFTIEYCKWIKINTLKKCK